MTILEPMTTEKRNLRLTVRSRIATLTPEQRSEASHRIFSEVESLPSFARVRVIALFAALPDEPQTKEFIERWRDRKRIVLPRIEGSEMRFYDYTPDSMQSGSFGIDEPQGATPCATEDIEMMIMPGVAFTSNGCRMGRGKGFYDRYLSQAGFRAMTIGVCFKEQMVEQIPTEMHDKRVDMVISL